MTSTTNSWNNSRSSLYSQPRRIQTALTLDDVARRAPAVFADSPVETVSAKYKFIPTRQVFEAIVENGYVPVDVRTARSRVESQHAKHMVVFQHQDALSMRAVGDTVTQIRLYNGHDGKTGYKLTAGMFRLVCLNGLVTSDGEQGSVRIRHMGNDVIQKVVDGIFEINDYLPQAIEMREEMKALPLDNEVMRIMAMGAIAVRWGQSGRGNLHLPDGTIIEMPTEEAVDVTNSITEDEDGTVGPGKILRAPVTIADMMQRQRGMGEEGDDLWTGLNIIQRNTIRAGMRGTAVNDVTRETTRRKVGAVTNIDKDYNINRALWVMANEMRKQLRKAVI